RAARAPTPALTPCIPAARSGSRTCWRTGRPPIVASSFPPPKREPAPAARTNATVRESISASSHRRGAKVPWPGRRATGLRSPTVRKGDPRMTDAPEPTPAAPIGTAAVIAAWSGLDQMAQLVVGGSIAAIVLTILGLPFGTWGSTDFVLLVLAASVVALVTAAMATTSRNVGPLALRETAAATVLAVLAVWNFIAILFHLDLGRNGGIIGLVFTVALAGAAIAVLVGAVNRLGGPRAFGVDDGRGAMVASAGFVLVLVGWAANLSISYWTMAEASLSLAVLTVATVIILASRRIESPVPVAWVGVVFGVLGAILGFGQWGDLNAL